MSRLFIPLKDFRGLNLTPFSVICFLQNCNLHTLFIPFIEQYKQMGEIGITLNNMDGARRLEQPIVRRHFGPWTGIQLWLVRTPDLHQRRLSGDHEGQDSEKECSSGLQPVKTSRVHRGGEGVHCGNK